MDPSRFDSLVRTLTTGGSRRRILGVLSALPLVGAALAAVPEDASAAKGKARGKRKHQDPEPERQRTGTEASSCARRCRKKSSKQARRKCRKRCTPPTPECTTTEDCPSGELCESGICIPIPDQCTTNADCDACERCEGGICVARCASDEVCRNGQCESVGCTADTDCGDCARCQDGQCRWRCKVTEVCQGGQCVPSCTPTTCAAQGQRCGSLPDGCGKTLDCGPCTCTPPCGTCERCAGTTCEACDPCCDDVCCDAATAICHAITGTCCVPDSTAQTCDGQCGDVTNNCGVVVDCGPCTCAPVCAACQICDDDTGQCVADPDQKGDACGDPGQICQADGTCACETASCPACTTCGGDGQCAACTDCCDASGTCQDGDTNTACGSSGTCDVCTGQEHCQHQACTCTSSTCQSLGKTCGSWSDGCGVTLACGTCPPCFTCVDGTCADTGGVVCGETCCTGTGQSCGGGGTPGVCGCTPTTCTAIYQEMCQYPGDCDYGICGSFPDGCGGTLDCGSCSHSCFECQNNICVRRPGSEVCGVNTCCINQCCFNANQGVCGVQARCAGGTCCPLGFSCCDARDGSNRSSCYNIQTYCQGQGLFCCAAGNTCCTDEPCCTSDAECKDGRRCIANGAPSTRGCCSFNF